MRQYTNTHLKTADLKASIEDNKIEISGLLSGPHTFKRLNTLNWLRHELSTESQALFFLPNNKQKPYLDYSSIKNLGEAYDYIICDQNIESLTLNEICKIHYILCMGTPIQGGTFRTTTKYLEITDKG